MSDDGGVYLTPGSMAKKIKKRAKAIKRGITRAPLKQILDEIGDPLLCELGSDPAPQMMTWAVGCVAAAWNCSRNPDETAARADLDRRIPKMLNAAFPSADELTAMLEAVMHTARSKYRRDPRYAAKIFVDKTGPGVFHVEVVAGVPKASATSKK
jgi:hypothetical protein